MSEEAGQKPGLFGVDVTSAFPSLTSFQDSFAYLTSSPS